MDRTRLDGLTVGTASRRGALRFLAAFAAGGLGLARLDRVAAATPASLSLNPEERKYNYSVTATFAHFKPNDTITLKWNSDTSQPKTLATTTADGSGNAATTFRVPSDVRGWHQLKGIGSLGRSATASLRVIPRIKLSKTTGPRGTSLTVYVYGFNAGEYIEVRWDPGRTYRVIGDGYASSLGSARIGVSVPSNARIGTRYVVIAGSDGSGDYTTFRVTFS